MRVETTRLHPSAVEIAERLRTAFPGVPLVALGQTVFWDEPVKAALCVALEALDPGAHTFMLGVNDHDYFSKTSAALDPGFPFAILEHNDGTTHDLWVASGELSMLFGSETVVSRDRLRDHGVELEKVTRGCPEGREACIDRVTAAWGWRGIAQTGHRREIAHEIRLSEVLPWLVELLRWGFTGSLALVVGADAKRAAALADEVVEFVQRYDREHPGALLSDAYEAAHRLFFRKLAGCDPDRVQTFTSTDIFRFNRETVSLPRFRLLDLFLRPESREVARTAYDAAVEGSQTYTLDRFGEGAIPFDLLIPGRGRGTIRILPDAVAVETPEPLRIPVQRPVESARHLAEVVERALGREVTLIGKGHVFVCMVTAESILVFHESGSAYVHRTARLLRTLAEHGFTVPLYPILRIRHHTWDSLAGTNTRFRLPEHLAEAFGAVEVTGTQFAERWRDVVAGEEHLLKEIAACGGTRELVSYLAGRDDGIWLQRLEEHTAAHDLLLEIRDRSQVFEERSQHLYEEIQRLKAEAQGLETEKGESYRRSIKPLRERLYELGQQGVTSGPEVDRIQDEIAAQEAPRAQMDQEIRERRERVAALEKETKEVRKARIESEKGPAASQARQTIAEMEREAERARLYLVRRALLVTLGLPQSDLRPTAWWLPFVDPSGQWFDNLVHAMELHFEHLSPVEPAREGAR